MEKLYCRTFQFVMKLAMGLLPWPTPKVLEGEDAFDALKNTLLNQKIQNVLIVADSMIVQLKLIDSLLIKLDEANIHYTIFANFQANPSDVDVENAYKLYQKEDFKALIYFGGGAAMDCGKALSAKIARPNKSVKELQGLFKVLKKSIFSFAIPTTSGTGSETTIAAVITEEKTHHKAAINDLSIVPDYVIFNPKLLLCLPPKITAITGMDALSHAVEAYTNQTYNSAYENELCKKAVSLIYENLYLAYTDGQNIEARQNMQKAAFYAGRAFTRGSVGYVHAIGHCFGGLYNVPHGLAMAILLPKVMRQYEETAYKRLADLADVCGMQGNDSKEKALAFIEWMEDLNQRMDLPHVLEVHLEDIDQMVEWAHHEANPLYPTPVVWSKNDFKNFILKLKEEYDEKM